LERIPQAQRSGDYYLVRAQALDACGRSDEAAAALSQGLRAHPTRADLYRYAAAFLIERGRAANAVTVMDRAIAAIPDNPEIGLMRAVALEGAGNTSEVEHTLQDIEKRWPDWNAVWLAQAIVSAWGGNDVRARQMVQLATALGAAGAEERFQRAAKAKAIQADAGGRGVALLRALFP
jgi:predicted Zn-dependent protease